MNKPRGLVTTASDERGRDTVYSLIAKENLPWIAPVGRLDKASEGLLLMTNDSEWADQIAAPQCHLDKTYHVQIDRVATPDLIERIEHGVRRGSETLRVKQARLLRAGKKNSWLEVVLDEGRNRQIRKIMESQGIEVLRLLRVAIGPLQLGELAKGSFHMLTHEEKLTLDAAMRRSSFEKPPRPASR